MSSVLLNHYYQTLHFLFYRLYVQGSNILAETYQKPKTSFRLCNGQCVCGHHTVRCKSKYELMYDNGWKYICTMYM